jgi:hypothetical protein
MKLIYIFLVLFPFQVIGANLLSFQSSGNYNLYFLVTDSVQKDYPFVKYKVIINYSSEEIKTFYNKTIRSSQKKILINCENNTYKILENYGYENFGAYGKKIVMPLNKGHVLIINSYTPTEVNSKFVCFEN